MSKYNKNHNNFNPDQVLIVQNSDKDFDTDLDYCLSMKYRDVTEKVNYYDQEEIQETFEKVQKLIASSKPHLGPKTIRFFPRIIILGPRGSGCRSQAQSLCHRFNLVFSLYSPYRFKCMYMKCK